MVTSPRPGKERGKLFVVNCAFASIRIYPHLQDTGGFFVAVFEKVKPMTQAERMMQEGNGDQQEQLVVEKEPELAETPEDDGAETAGSSSNQDETMNVVVPSKRPASVSTASDSRASKEAPFELLSPDSPELAEIRYLACILILSLIKGR